MTEKSCSVCKVFKSLDEFAKDNRATDGRASNCKECQSIKRKAWADKQETKPKASEAKASAIREAGEKTCSKCRETKPLSEYHKDKRNADGLYGHCKSCHYAMTQTYAHTEKGKESIRQSAKANYEERGGREKSRIRNAKPSSIEKRAEYRQTEAGKEAQGRKDAKRRQEQIQKLRAKDAVNNAIKRGALPLVNTLKCARCDNQAEEFHHESYAMEDFLRVTPLCKSCHAKTYTETYE